MPPRRVADRGRRRRCGRCPGRRRQRRRLERARRESWVSMRVLLLLGRSMPALAHRSVAGVPESRLRAVLGGGVCHRIDARSRLDFGHAVLPLQAPDHPLPRRSPPRAAPSRSSEAGHPHQSLARRSPARGRRARGPRCSVLGCFWGDEKDFWQLPGVVTTAVGYAGGHTPNPTYRGGLLRADRSRRGGAGRVRPVK